MDWWEQLKEQWRIFRDDLMLMASPWFMIAGLVVLLIAAGFWWQERTWSWREPHAVATITENVAQQDAKGNVDYFPHFRFRLPDGNLVETASTKGAWQPAFATGAVVATRYKATDPEDATLITTWRVYPVGIVLGVIGVLLMDIGAGYFSWRKRRNRRGPRKKNTRGFYGFRPNSKSDDF